MHARGLKNCPYGVTHGSSVYRYASRNGPIFQAAFRVQSSLSLKIEPELVETVTGLTVKDFHLLGNLRVFNTEQMNQAVFAFRRYEDASLRYTGIESHEGLAHYGLYDTVVARE